MIPTSTVMSTSTSLTPGEEALIASLDSSTFLDIKFFLFSARLTKSDKRRVGKPRLVQAVSSAVQKVEELNARESKLSLWSMAVFGSLTLAKFCLVGFLRPAVRSPSTLGFQKIRILSRMNTITSQIVIWTTTILNL